MEQSGLWGDEAALDAPQRGAGVYAVQAFCLGQNLGEGGIHFGRRDSSH